MNLYLNRYSVKKKKMVKKKKIIKILLRNKNSLKKVATMKENTNEYMEERNEKIKKSFKFE